MKFCSNCGTAVEHKVPVGDNRARHVCPACASIYYQNPKIVAGCITELNGDILLCKRAIEPRYGFWTLPAGFMENDETSFEAAVRETWEEARAKVDVIELFALFNLPHVNQVYMMFRASLREPAFAPGDESLEVACFAEEEIPWTALAFPTIHHTLKFYLDDRRAGCFRLHTGDIVRRDGKAHFYERRPQLSDP
jgi:ADP-ribose pyrophosphatase YjhB (NUDIX family)